MSNPVDDFAAEITSRTPPQTVSSDEKAEKPAEPDEQTPAEPAGNAPAWHHEPASNFKIDQAGRIRLRENGEPIRRGGKPRKFQPGDTPASERLPGRQAKPAAEPTPRPQSRIVADGVRVDPPDDDAPAEPDDQADDEAPAESVDVARVPLGKKGRGVTRIVFGALKAFWGPPAEPTDEEREEIEEATEAVFGGVLIHPLIALGLAIAIYVVSAAIRTAAENAKQQKGSANDGGSETRSNSGGQRDGQVNTGKGPLFTYE